ncbi:thermostable hemolysin [Sorangium sp. So ce1078]|uniref:thermostable hemolysin n=1 Tax=Sorangium sp. So ce1078 TaxID=3133329 RepID=UPI003F615727
MRIKVSFGSSDDWSQAVDLVRQKYRRSYGAEVMPNPDCFVICTADHGLGAGASKVVACAGMTFSSDARLFSEQYLDEPIEQTISRMERLPAGRDEIVEVGSLASVERRAGTELIRAVPILAWCLGKRYILCTITASLKLIFDAVGLNFQPIRGADADRLGAGTRDRWGSYYDQRPQTGYIRLDAIAEMFARNTGRYRFTALDLSLEEHRRAERYHEAT